MKSKTILYLRTDLGNQNLQAGGSVGHTLGIIRAYSDSNYTIVVASSALWHILEKEELSHSYRLRLPFFCRWLGTKISAICSTFFFLPCIIYLIIKYRPAYMYQRYSVLNGVGVLASIITRIPLVLEYNGSEVWIERYWTFKQKLRLVKIIAFIEWLNLRYATLIVVVSRALQHDLVKRGFSVNKIITNPNGVDIKQFDPAYLINDRQDIRALLKIESQIVVGFIGTFSAWHGINVLSKIIPQVIQQNNKIHFLLIGDGQLCGWLQQELMHYKNYVTYTGVIAQEQAQRYLAACDIFICPTQPNEDGTPFFGSPTKLFEYMSLAKPIIASAIDQVADIISPAYHITQNRCVQSPNACGFLVEHHDIEGFVYAVTLVARWSEQERAAMGICARNKVIQEHTWAKHVARIMEHPILS